MNQPSSPSSIAERGNQIAFFEEAQRLADAVHVMGPKVGKIAVYDLDQFVPLAELVAANKKQPGTFAAFLLNIKVIDTVGRERTVIREGRVKEGVLKFSELVDLMRGWPVKSMAAYFGMAPTDTRLYKVGHAIADVCEKYLNLAVGFEAGSFRVLTHKAVARKEEARIVQMLGNERNHEQKIKALKTRGALPSGQQTIQLQIFPASPDEAENEPNT